ncbi:MAG: IS110 family transposase [Acidimicrobiia bacterium]
MPESAYSFYVGIDWATAVHQVAVLDPERRLIAQRSVAHTGEALAEFADWLTALANGAPERVAVAIEVPRGAVVETLLERGFPVFALNPKQLDRFRDRHTVAGAKDDRRDAFVLADALRTDRPAFRRVHPQDPLIVQLRELSRVEEDLLQEFTRLSNRLREQLLRFYPQPLALCPAADEPWLWAVLALASTPAAAQRLTRAKVNKLLRAHHIRRFVADALLTQLQTPALHVAPGTAEAASVHIALLVPRLRLLRDQRADCARRIEDLLTRLEEDPDVVGQPVKHRDVAILRSLPGVGRTVAATMLAEGGRALAARDYHVLRAQAGIAPVTQQSGKRALVLMRLGCNRRLRNAVYHWGRVGIQYDPRARAHYLQLRQRGHRHGRALRGVIDRLLAMLMAMLRAGTLYDPQRRQVGAAPV